MTARDHRPAARPTATGADRLIAVLHSQGDPGDSGMDAVTFSPDGHSLATGEGNGTTDLWNLANRTITATFPNPGGQGVMSVAFDPVGFSPPATMTAAPTCGTWPPAS